MKKKYFLTALFQNKYGTAFKYYDDSGWHWMLSGDKPILFDSQEAAMPLAIQLEVDVISRVNINEIIMYENVFETRVPVEEYDSLKAIIFPSDIIHQKVESKYAYFITKKAYHESAKWIIGLYPIDKKEDKWIFGLVEMEKETFDPDTYANICFHKLEEAKAKMTMFGSEKAEIQKIEAVLLFVRKIIKNQTPASGDFDVEKPPEDLIDEAHQALENAKLKMNAKGFEKSEITKFESVAFFINKIRKPKGISAV